MHSARWRKVSNTDVQPLVSEETWDVSQVQRDSKKGQTCQERKSSRMTVVPTEKARTGISILGGWGEAEAAGGSWAGCLHGLSRGAGRA